MHMDCNTYGTYFSGMRPFWLEIMHLCGKPGAKHSPTMCTVDHSYPRTHIHTFLAIFFSLLLSFSPTRLSGERLSVIRRGLGGQIAIYSLPVGEVCVFRL